jgi:predicted RNA-binding protein associated with RNAse of E/G family
VAYLETKIRYDGTVAEYDCQLIEYSSERVTLFYELPESRVVDAVTLPKGVYTIAYYWKDRPYNVYHWITPHGTTLAYYFNIAEETILQPTTLTWRDMIVDVICYPNGSYSILDQKELPAPIEQFEGGRVKEKLDHLIGSLDEVLEEISKATKRLMELV